MCAVATAGTAISPSKKVFAADPVGPAATLEPVVVRNILNVVATVLYEPVLATGINRTFCTKLPLTPAENALKPCTPKRMGAAELVKDDENCIVTAPM
jgi:hypothetical protein